jgi:hypothetical protein
MTLEVIMKRGEEGFSVVEGLVAATILLLVAVGLLPLFAQSMLNNNRGNDYLQASTHAKTGEEDLQRLPFDNASLSLQAGTELLTSQFTRSGLGSGTPVGPEDWLPGAGPNALWIRATRVRQFGVRALDDGRLTDDEAQPAGTESRFIQLKEIEVELTSGRSVRLLGGINPVEFRVLKPF